MASVYRCKLFPAIIYLAVFAKHNLANFFKAFYLLLSVHRCWF